jgi:hypothetical protein
MEQELKEERPGLKGNWTLWGPTWSEGPVIAERVAFRVFALTGEELERIVPLREGVVALHTASRWVLGEQIVVGAGSRRKVGRGERG